MKAFRRLVSLPLLVTASVWVPALSWGGEHVVQEPDVTVYRKNTVVDFGEVAVEGELTKPEGSYVLNDRKSDFPSLVKVRDNFIPELQKSAENL